MVDRLLTVLTLAVGGCLFALIYGLHLSREARTLPEECAYLYGKAVTLQDTAAVDSFVVSRSKPHGTTCGALRE